LIAIAVLLISGFCGPDIWSEDARRILPLPSFLLPKNAQLSDVYLVFVLFALVCGHAPFWSVSYLTHPRSCRAGDTYEEDER